MSIDYDRQFVALTPWDFLSVSAQWLHHRTYTNAKQAFESARRTESRGLAVAFAKWGDTYYVWTGEKA